MATEAVTSSSLSQNDSVTGADELVSRPAHAAFKVSGRSNISSRVYDTAGWTFNSTDDDGAGTNLTFLAVITLIVFIVYIMLKVWKWRSDSAKIKARGDVEFGHDLEVNYGIVTPGDKEFCPVDIRSDTTSVYDTISSFRLLGANGQPIPHAQLDTQHPYQDTVTSIKSLVLHKCDTGQYDSVQSYKAFLQKVTQNKDLAVEVKLLENYPLRSKSSDFMVLEEESSEKSERNTAAKLFKSFLPNKGKGQGGGKCAQAKKNQTRKTGGDLPPAMRKRSASNPISRRPPRKPTSSLPSINHTGSSDSEEEESLQSFRSDRKRHWAERKKMSHSNTGGKVGKDMAAAAATAPILTEKELLERASKRRRHYSADSVRRPRLHQLYPGGRLGKPLLAQYTLEEPEESSIKDTTEENGGESSSENPPSSQSSEADALSEVVSLSEEEDEDTRDNTLMSTASDRTLDNNKGAGTSSDSEDAVFLPSPTQPVQNTHNTNASEHELSGARDWSRLKKAQNIETSPSGGVTSDSEHVPLTSGERSAHPSSSSVSQSSSPRKVQRFHVTFVSDSAESCMQSD